MQGQKSETSGKTGGLQFGAAESGPTTCSLPDCLVSKTGHSSPGAHARAKGASHISPARERWVDRQMRKCALSRSEAKTDEVNERFILGVMKRSFRAPVPLQPKPSALALG